VFNALVFLIQANKDRQNFRPMIEVYIRQHFSRTHAYHKLVASLMKLLRKREWGGRRG
jgi:hypothetical protein